jgi:hypothetical protein
MGYVLLIAGLGWCLFWVARLRPPWPTALPITAPPAGAVLLFSVFSLAALGGVVISQSIGQPLRAPAEDAFQTMLALLCVIVAGVAGALLVSRGRARAHSATALVGIYLCLVGLIALSLELPAFMGLLGVTWFPGSLLSVSVVQVLAGVVAVLSAVWYVARRWAGKDALAPLAASVILLAGIEAVAGLTNVVLPGLATLGDYSLVATTILFLLGVSWDVWTSGDTTNGNSRAFPRSIRLLLYFGYTVFAASTLLYTSAERIVPTGKPLVANVPTGELGLVALGLPFVALEYALRLGRWRGATAPVADRVPTTTTRFTVARGVAGGAAICGTLALVAVVLLTTLDIIPRVLVHPTTGVYTTITPGSTCDRGGALWQELGTLTLDCAGQQTHALLPGHGQGELVFTLPNAAPLAPSFRISLRIGFSQLAHGCAGLYTSSADHQITLSEVCTDGAFVIVSANRAIAPVTGIVVTKSSYTLGLTIAGSSLSLAVDGATRAHFSLGAGMMLAQTGIAVVNQSDAPGAALLSDFTYTLQP